MKPDFGPENGERRTRTADTTISVAARNASNQAKILHKTGFEADFPIGQESQFAAFHHGGLGTEIGQI
jgi:hypothetical protein